MRIFVAYIKVSQQTYPTQFFGFARSNVSFRTDMCIANLFLRPPQDRLTPLHVAVLSGKPAVVETLLGHGANVEIKGEKRVTGHSHNPVLPFVGFQNNILERNLEI